MEDNWTLVATLDGEAGVVFRLVCAGDGGFGFLGTWGASSENLSKNCLWKILFGKPSLVIRIASITPAQRSCSTTIFMLKSWFDFIGLGLMHRTYCTLVAPMVPINCPSWFLNLVDTVVWFSIPFLRRGLLSAAIKETRKEKRKKKRKNVNLLEHHIHETMLGMMNNSRYLLQRLEEERRWRIRLLLRWRACTRWGPLGPRPKESHRSTGGWWWKIENRTSFLR